MAPPAADIDVQSTPSADFPVKGSHEKALTGSRISGPLKYSGSLDSYKQADVTAVIGREFPTLQISEILHDDAKIRDLAILGTFP